jgi:isopropylmalate/homocitrate/citramalate synthase
MNRFFPVLLRFVLPVKRNPLCFSAQETVDWFNAIRAARFHYLQVAFPGASDEEVSRLQNTSRAGRETPALSSSSPLQRQQL